MGKWLGNKSIKVGGYKLPDLPSGYSYWVASDKSTYTVDIGRDDSTGNYEGVLLWINRISDAHRWEWYLDGTEENYPLNAQFKHEIIAAIARHKLGVVNV